MTPDIDAARRVRGWTAARGGLTTVTVLWVAVLAGMLAWMTWRAPELRAQVRDSRVISDGLWEQMESYDAVLAVFVALLIAVPAVLAGTAAVARLRYVAVSYLAVVAGLLPIGLIAVWFGSLT